MASYSTLFYERGRRSRAPSLQADVYLDPASLYNHGSEWDATFATVLQPQKGSESLGAPLHDLPLTPTSPNLALSGATATSRSPLQWFPPHATPSPHRRPETLQVHLPNLDSLPKLDMELAAGRPSKRRASRTPPLEFDASPGDSKATRRYKSKKIAAKLPPLQSFAAQSIFGQPGQPLHGEQSCLQSIAKPTLSLLTRPPNPDLDSSLQSDKIFLPFSNIPQTLEHAHRMDGYSSMPVIEPMSQYCTTPHMQSPRRALSVAANPIPLPGLGRGHDSSDREDADIVHRARAAFQQSRFIGPTTVEDHGVEPNSPQRSVLLAQQGNPNLPYMRGSV
ncbi:hypothetical protein P389DRAFT_213179 [Cystobasidium minutum MCA 4210]|uniref:uncharacterized protein n=1 Tax=Cystobasidium minutum MCA 4210 TaxID=1397322 RepID=UPI0034CF32C5|eukprot:jgi/Rhomi1/213179/estExt_Genemark1.C_90147